ncbi:response regulator transcription factor [Nocardioides humi]|uniref:Response regulator transcription factor n=1 Tax=Nocardioides humi TaxID=449461 RepID=A0ABN1ZX15_9ACTN|nr:response regulator transcription factor [Nocardioides humi]
MSAAPAVVVVRNEEELIARAGHLLATASDVVFAAADLRSWSALRGTTVGVQPPAEVRLRKLYRPHVVLDPAAARQLHEACERHGAQVRITPDELSETVILDGRMAIIAGDVRRGQRSYSVLTQPDVVQGVLALFEVAWRTATDLAVYDAQIAEARRVAPQLLDLLGQGIKDETAARMLGLGVRTYRRRVAELMEALGAESRFQAGVRARELGLV